MVVKFTKEQAGFLQDELNMFVTVAADTEISKEQRGKIVNYCMDVEASESGKSVILKEPFSERGKIAASLVDAF